MEEDKVPVQMLEELRQQLAMLQSTTNTLKKQSRQKKLMKARRKGRIWEEPERRRIRMRTPRPGIQKEMELYLVGKGICFTLPLTGVSSIVANGLLKGALQDKSNGREGRMTAETRKYDLIVAAVESGYADEAMNAAREAGAAGGTLIKAMTLNNRKAEQLIGVTLQQETEILIILTKCEGKLPIMRAIQETAGLKTDAGGVLFSLPVDNLIGVGSMSPDTGAGPAED